MHPLASGQIGESLVDGMLLHQRREPPHNVEHPFRDQAVRLVIVREHDQIRTDPDRLVQRYAPLDAQGLRLVAGTRDDVAFLARDHRPAPVRGIQRLFDGREERVPVQVRDGAWKGINHQRLCGVRHACRNSADAVSGQDDTERWFRYVPGSRYWLRTSGCADMISAHRNDSCTAGSSGCTPRASQPQRSNPADEKGGEILNACGRRKVERRADSSPAWRIFPRRRKPRAVFLATFPWLPIIGNNRLR